MHEPPRRQRLSLYDVLNYALQTQTGERVLLIMMLVGSPVLLACGIWFTVDHHPGGVALLVITGICTTVIPLAIRKYRRRWRTDGRPGQTS